MSCKYIKSAKKGFFALFIAVAAILLFVFRDKIIAVLHFLPSCPIYNTFGIMCPGCGNTRSIKALFEGDILLSLKYNIAPVVIIICALLLYIELLSDFFGKRIKIITRNKYVIYMILFILVLYYLLRNLF